MKLEHLLNPSDERKKKHYIIDGRALNLKLIKC